MAEPARTPAKGTEDETSLVLDWLAGEPVRIRSLRMLTVVGLLAFASLMWALVTVRDATRTLRTGRPPAPLPADQGDVAYGVPLETRKQIFAELAAAEPAARAEGKKSFNGPGLEWSADDHRGAFERKLVASLTGKYRLSTTQVYLVLDEGIRSHWPGPDGKPLEATTTPLHPRRNYGW